MREGGERKRERERERKRDRNFLNKSLDFDFNILNKHFVLNYNEFISIIE